MYALIAAVVIVATARDLQRRDYGRLLRFYALVATALGGRTVPFEWADVVFIAVLARFVGLIKMIAKTVATAAAYLVTEFMSPYVISICVRVTRPIVACDHALPRVTQLRTSTVLAHRPESACRRSARLTLFHILVGVAGSREGVPQSAQRG